ncbi:hypothetical protein [Pseudobacteriovorax antillogorgiicola]|uniref:Uncharacterized protein n=1 Tax=Pseudobacteriovorax antillogorgiicola TaxID=1513793 RepID=A0A1Y6C8Z6_9BACT|nr:hypothetical protein [Pseudobacteriovorax antillogorgiicola]TCS49076.1 hypothetical protein EDD56_116119 [Pseudobacteriovorax antillogorgiicola]SMF52087.1 hypothetical protein SAMN06296036_11635 [Pseudobacteriovorax antillogorgiicola]
MNVATVINIPFYLIFGLLISSCGTEIGNGLRPEKQATTASSPDPEAVEEGASAPDMDVPSSDDIPDTAISDLVLLANTCASPVSRGMLGTYTSSNNQRLSVTLVDAGYLLQDENNSQVTIELDTTTSDAFDITWVDAETPSFICTQVEAGDESNTSYEITYEATTTSYEFSWTESNSQITSVMINGRQYTQEP